MKVYTNTKQIQQKQRIGTIASLAGFSIMLISLFVSWQPESALIAWVGMFAGLGVAMLGTYHVNRWVRPPLTHDVLAESLERLSGRYILFNHIGLVPHLLLSPRGLIAIKAKKYEGPVTYDPENERWTGKFSLWRLYSTGLTAEGLGDPSEEVTKSRNDVLAWLELHLPDLVDDIPVAGIACFVAPKVTLNIPDEPPIPIAQPETIKEEVQKLFKRERHLKKEHYKKLRNLLEKEAQEVAGAEKKD
ncbi:MAG: nuclease-related domain-containing protein [Ardenticatenaceae bacterium]